MLIARWVGLVALLIGLAAVCLGAFTFGGNMGGPRPPSSQCSVYGLPPAVGGLYYENTVVTGQRTLFPLGMTCTYDSPDDNVGPQTVENPRWLATIIAYGTPLVMAFAVILLRPRSPRPRGSAQ